MDKKCGILRVQGWSGELKLIPPLVMDPVSVYVLSFPIDSEKCFY